MSAECDKCGADLVGTQYDEGGLQCIPCDLRVALAESQAREARLVAALKELDGLKSDWKMDDGKSAIECGLEAEPVLVAALSGAGWPPVVVRALEALELAVAHAERWHGEGQAGEGRRCTDCIEFQPGVRAAIEELGEP